MSARLTVLNVSRAMSGDHVTCQLTSAQGHVVSRAVNIRVAGKRLDTRAEYTTRQMSARDMLPPVCVAGSNVDGQHDGTR